MSPLCRKNIKIACCFNLSSMLLFINAWDGQVHNCYLKTSWSHPRGTIKSSRTIALNRFAFHELIQFSFKAIYISDHHQVNRLSYRLTTHHMKMCLIVLFVLNAIPVNLIEWTLILVFLEKKKYFSLSIFSIHRSDAINVYTKLGGGEQLPQYAFIYPCYYLTFAIFTKKNT